MPRVITKRDIAAIRNYYVGFRVEQHPTLGTIISATNDYFDGARMYAYSVTNDGSQTLWVTKRTIEKRKRIGRPKKRVKQFLREMEFGLEEMALVEDILNGG